MLSNKADRIAMPSWKWPDTGWYFTAIGAFLGLLLLVAPDSIKLTFLPRVILAIVASLAPGLWIIGTHIQKVLVALYLRSKDYDVIRDSYDEVFSEQQNSKSLINALMRERENRRTLRISHCYCYLGNAYIALTRKKGFRVGVGDSFTVVDQENGQALGDFMITEAQEESYIGKSQGNINAVWFGYIRQAGTARSEPPPTAVALFIDSNGETS